MSRSNRSGRQVELTKGIKAELPIALGVIPFGMIFGVLALEAGLPPNLAQAMSAIVFCRFSPIYWRSTHWGRHTGGYFTADNIHCESASLAVQRINGWPPEPSFCPLALVISLPSHRRSVCGDDFALP